MVVILSESGVEPPYSPNITSNSKSAESNSSKTSPLSADSSCDVLLDKEKLQDILTNIPSAVIVLERPHGKIIYVNKRAVELHGVDPCGLELDKHASSLKIFSLDGKICPTEELYTYRAMFKGETIRDKPIIIERADGARFIVNVNTKPLYDKQGNLSGAIAIFDDMTERLMTEEELRESEERLNMAQRIAHVGNWEYYVKEDKAVWSEELFRIFGLPQKPYGPNVNEYLSYIHPDDRERVKGLMTGSQMSPQSYDYRIVRLDGSVRTIHTERVVREVDQDNRPIRVVGVEQDITERKQAEDKLQEYTKNLERLVEERTKQLKDAERLAAIGQTAGMIGHDIRNPLQAIISEVYLIRDEVDNSAESEYKKDVQESLNIIQQQADYMNKIVADIQDYARPLKPEYTNVDLQSIVPDMLSTVTIPDNIEAGALFQKNLPPVKLDLTFLKRILVNLVTNAIQAMPKGGKLLIHCSQQGNSVQIVVSDTGAGIPDEVKPKIFQPLMTTKSKGQGFGLAVVKRLVEAQGGTIAFESKSEEGTKFILTFNRIAEPSQIL